MNEQKETTNHSEKTCSMSCPEVCKKHPHAIFAGSVLLALIIGIIIGSSFSLGRGHGDFEKRGMTERGRYNDQRGSRESNRWGDQMPEQMPSRQNGTEASPITSTGTKMMSPTPATGTGVQK